MIQSKNLNAITQVTNQYTLENITLTKSIYQLIYYFRGGLSREDAWAMSPAERDIAFEFLQERMKEVGDLVKKQIPVFW